MRGSFLGRVIVLGVRIAIVIVEGDTQLGAFLLLLRWTVFVLPHPIPSLRACLILARLILPAAEGPLAWAEAGEAPTAANEAAPLPWPGVGPREVEVLP